MKTSTKRYADAFDVRYDLELHWVMNGTDYKEFVENSYTYLQDDGTIIIKSYDNMTISHVFSRNVPLVVKYFSRGNHEKVQS